jgi:hypothetical protein
MKNDIVCPKKCNGGYADKIRKIPQRQATITSRIALAAKLPRNEQVFTCLYCSAVWLDSFDERHFRNVTVVLGEYGGSNSANEFLPAPWLQEAMSKLSDKSKGQIL